MPLPFAPREVGGVAAAPAKDFDAVGESISKFKRGGKRRHADGMTYAYDSIGKDLSDVGFGQGRY